jgi:DUF4097 and DUF4098 domain-containing protein YvlB
LSAATTERPVVVHEGHATKSIVRPVVIVLTMTVCISMPVTARANDAREEVTRTFDRTLTVTGTPTLSVEHRLGDVRVRAHARNELRIQATIHVSAETRAEATMMADRIQIDVQESLGTITITTRYPDPLIRESLRRERNRDLSFSVDYDLLVPERLAVNLHNRFGDIAVAGMKGGGSISNASGKITAVDGSGRYDIENRFGLVEASRLAGDLIIRGANGPVSANSITGMVTISNKFGNVIAAAIRGDAIIVNANGSVEATGISGRADLRTTFGRVDFRDVGMVTASSANGSVTGANVNGPATVNATFGNVTLRNVSRDVRVINANGAIALQDARGGAELSTRFGRVEALSVKGGLRVSAANGPVRVSDVEGPVYLKTSFGPIEAERVRGALTAENSSGSVSATAIGGSATVSTSFGPVLIKEVDGRLDVTNKSGSVEAWPTVRTGTCHDVQLTTSFSPMIVHLPDTGYALAARTTFGRIQADVPITATGTLGNNAVSGTIGRGGCNLQLTNSSGDIRISKAVITSR